jgi:hypothetical protein
MNKHERKRTQRKKRMEKRAVGQGSSRYAEKVQSGRQMYGNGRLCCGHGCSPLEPKKGGAA